MLIVFFDGYCGLCSGVVDFLIERDRNRRLRYSPLQGETAKIKLEAADIEDLDTVVVVRNLSAFDESTKDPQTFRKSAAVLEALKELGGLYALSAKIGGLFPRILRDAAYDVIAKNRFKIFGRRDSCRAPTKDERDLFLP